MAAKPTPLPTPIAWETTPEIEQAWLEEARRRLHDANTGKVELLSLDDVRACLAKRRG